MFRLFVAAAIVALQSPHSNADQSNSIALAESRGLRLYEAYRIAPLAIAKAQTAAKDRVREVMGYVVTNSGNDYVLTFVGESDEGQAYAVWRGRYVDGIEMEGRLIPRTSVSAGLSEDERLTFELQRAALKYVVNNQEKLGVVSCSGDVMPNMVVLRRTKPDPELVVYIMSPQIDKDVVSLGGHYRITMDQNARVKSFRGLTEGCHDIDLLHDGQRLVADYVGHRADPYPNEIHVFASLAAEARIMVDTGQPSMWKVEKGRIQTDDTPPPH